MIAERFPELLSLSSGEKLQLAEELYSTVFAGKARLTDEMWAKNLFHPDEDRFIGAIFAAVWQAVALLKSGEHKQFQLKRKVRRLETRLAVLRRELDARLCEQTHLESAVTTRSPVAPVVRSRIM